MELINKIADTLYQNLASKFGAVNIADENAGAVLESNQARLFDFDYIVEGEKYGPVTVSIIDPKNFTIYFAESLSGDLPDTIQREWFHFLKEMRMFAKKNMMNFDVRNIGKNQLDKRDYEAITKNSSQYTTDEITMESVSKLYGSTKTSYQTVESARIIVKHRTPVDEDKMGSRSRQIQSIFIENSSKERFKFPYKYLPGARAMARHIHNGGNPHDALGSHIIESVKEMYELRNFVRKLDRADGFVNEDARNVIADAKKRWKGLKETLITLSKPKGYKLYSENFEPTESVFDESDIEELKTKLTRTVDQTEFDEMLPTVLKAQRKIKESNSPIHDIIQGKSKIVVTPNEEEDALIKKQFAFVKANKFKKPNDTQGLDHTENPLHALIRRIMATISVRTKDDDLARAIFNLDDSFTDKTDANLMTAIASKWLKGDVEVQDFDPKYKMKPQDESADFEKWTDSVVKEGTWHLPSSSEDVAKFKEIMANPIPAGEEGQAATDAIGSIFGDDELYDDLYVVGTEQGDGADCRPAIIDWLKMAVQQGYSNEHQPYMEEMLKAVTESVEEHDIPGKKMQVTKTDREGNTLAWQRFKAGDPRYEYIPTGDEEEKEVEEAPVQEDNKTIPVNKLIPLAGDSIWDKEGENPKQVKVSSITIMNPYEDGGYMDDEEDDSYRSVTVEHDGPWDIYTDTGFEKAISELVGFEVGFTEQGMQEDGHASMEGMMNDSIKEDIDPEQLLDKLEMVFDKNGEPGLAKAVKMSPEQFDRELEICAGENGLHLDDDRQEVINCFIDQYVDQHTSMESIDEPNFEEAVDHMKKLAGVMSSSPKVKKAENQTTPRSIHKRKQQ